MNISSIISDDYTNYQYQFRSEKKTPEEDNPLKPKDVAGKPLSEEDKKQVDELKKTDKKVRANEQAHMAAGGGVVRGGPSYSYQKGPDGRSYAVGGEVSIDTSKEKTPQQTITKMQRVKAAALAPGDPSAQDRSAASQARAELLKNQRNGENAAARTDPAQSASNTYKGSLINLIA